MGRVGRALRGLGVIAVMAAATPVLARDDDADRQARRHELRQQLQAERERWRADGRGPAGYGAMPGPAARGHGSPPPYGPPPAPGYGPPPGWGGGHRLSPDERRALRQDLRELRP